MKAHRSLTLEQMRAGCELDDDRTLTYPGPDGFIGIWQDGDEFVFEDDYGGLAKVIRHRDLRLAEEALWRAFWLRDADGDPFPNGP